MLFPTGFVLAGLFFSCASLNSKYLTFYLSTPFLLAYTPSLLSYLPAPPLLSLYPLLHPLHFNYHNLSHPPDFQQKTHCCCTPRLLSHLVPT